MPIFLKKPTVFLFFLITSFFAFAEGITLLAHPEQFTAPAFVTLFEVLPYDIIATLLIIAGTALFSAFIMRLEILGRVGLASLAAYQAMETAAFYASDSSPWAVIRPATFGLLFLLVASANKYQGVD